MCKGGFPLENELTDETLQVCACIANLKQLCQSGPRSLLGIVLLERIDPWLNAGPSAWMVFTGDNGDIKFPHRMPIIPETHERMTLLDVQRTTCCASVSPLQMAYDMQAGQAVAAGYFGGYSAKMQDIGQKELQRLREGLERKVASSARSPAWEALQTYSGRLLKYLEAKGILRTAVESLNLSVNAAHPDILKAECIRTFPTVAFPVALLLKREEVETLKVSGRSIIPAVYHGKGEGRKTFTDPPFDLLYGFRGKKHQVDLFSPFEMLRGWRMEKVLPPTKRDEHTTAEWTDEGKRYMKECISAKVTPHLGSRLSLRSVGDSITHHIARAASFGNVATSVVLAAASSPLRPRVELCEGTASNFVA